MTTAQMDRPPEVDVEVERLGFHVGGANILRDIDLRVGRGEFLGIIGPNGAGKTTLFNLLTGLLKPTDGLVKLRGRDLRAVAPSKRAQLGMGRTFQTSLLFNALSVFENVRLAAAAHQGGSMKWWHRPTSQDPPGISAAEALEAVGLGPLADRPAGELSHGDKRKVELAILVASGADVLLLDEPMAGVNVEDVHELSALIARLHAEGRTVLMVEHHIAVVLGLADRVAVLHHGRLLACGAPEAVMADQEVQTAYLGEPL